MIGVVPAGRLGEELLQQRHRFLPERTDAPFVAFAMEMHAGLGLQLQNGRLLLSLNFSRFVEA